EVQRAPSRRAARRRNLLLAPRGPNCHRELAAPLQHDQAARLTWIQATSTGGVRARLRRVAGCATPSGSAGHAGETANFKLTFHLDHSAGADQYCSQIGRCCDIGPLQLPYLRLGYARDKAKMIIDPALLVTMETPTANVTMGIWVRVEINISLRRHGSL